MFIKILVFVVISSVCFDKGVSEKEGNYVGLDPEFRLLKYRDVWEKALEKKLDRDRLTNLARKLKKLDKAGLELKRQKESGDHAYDELSEKTLKDALLLLLHEYGLNEDEEEKLSDIKTQHFQDVRLQKAWKRAIEECDFSGSELRELHDKFHVSQKKLNDYISTIRQIENLKKKTSNKSGKTDSSSDGRTQLQELQRRLDTDYATLDDDVYKLVQKVGSRVKKDTTSELTDERVVELLKKAESVMLKKDLTIFKVELEYLQNRISKLRHWEKICENLREQLEPNNFDKQLMDEYGYAKAKVKELKPYIKKLHSTYLDRLSQTKDEL